MDLGQSDSIFAGVMESVVHRESTLDVTDAVMRYLERQANAMQAANRGNVALLTAVTGNGLSPGTRTAPDALSARPLVDTAEWNQIVRVRFDSAQ